MVVFLLKSSACLAILLMFYKLLLEKECMHTLKRYYLLAALVLALVIPSITFVQYVEVAPAPFSFNIEEAVPMETSAPMVIEETLAVDWTVVFWAIYALGVLFFSLRFLKNIFGIAHNIRNNPKLRFERLINVLLQDSTVPHTFFNYIFLNKKKFEANAIPKEVLVHEAAHAKQKHSIDILLVELLQIIFWFNPLVYLTKNAIKLNHEFLADQAVLKNGTDTPQYQNILLAFASSASSQENQSNLANAITYSSIKKRFTVMKTRTSRKSILLRCILLLPLIATLVFGFSETKRIEFEKADTLFPAVIVQELNENDISIISNQNKPTSKDFEKWKDKSEFAIWIHEKPVDNSALDDYLPKDFAHYFLSFVYQNARSERFPQSYQVHLYTEDEFEKNVVKDTWLIEIMINRNGQLLFQSELVELDDLASHLHKLNKNLSKEERQKTIRGVIVSNKSAPKEVIAAVERILNEYGVAQIDIRGSENTFLPAQNGATQKQLSKYNALAKKYNAQTKEKRVIPSKDLKSLEHIYQKMSEQQKADAQPFPECPDSKSDSQEGASENQMAEYNALAKKYNGMLADGGNIRIRKSDIDRLEYLHGIMSESQRANSEPFPDFPEPPEPPAPPSPTDPGAREFAANKIQEIIENQDPHDGNTISIYNPTRSYYTGDRKAIRDIIAVEAAYPPSPTSPLAPNQNLDKPTQWTLTSGANRDSRTVEASSPIPPVTPTIGVHADRRSYSKELNNSINEYLVANKIYEEAIADYRNKSIGDKENLWNITSDALTF